MTKPIYQPLITLGNILTIVTMGIGGLWAFAQLSTSHRVLEQRVIPLEARAAVSGNDHDILIRIEAQLAQVRQQLERQNKN